MSRHKPVRQERHNDSSGSATKTSDAPKAQKIAQERRSLMKYVLAGTVLLSPLGVKLFDKYSFGHRLETDVSAQRETTQSYIEDRRKHFKDYLERLDHNPHPIPNAAAEKDLRETLKFAIDQLSQPSANFWNGFEQGDLSGLPVSKLNLFLVTNLLPNDMRYQIYKGLSEGKIAHPPWAGQDPERHSQTRIRPMNFEAAGITDLIKGAYDFRTAEVWINSAEADSDPHHSDASLLHEFKHAYDFRTEIDKHPGIKEQPEQLEALGTEFESRATRPPKSPEDIIEFPAYRVWFELENLLHENMFRQLFAENDGSALGIPQPESDPKLQKLLSESPSLDLMKFYFKMDLDPSNYGKNAVLLEQKLDQYGFRAIKMAR